MEILGRQHATLTSSGPELEMSHPVPSLPCVPLTTAHWMLVPFLVAQALLAVQDAIGIGASVLLGKLR